MSLGASCSSTRSGFGGCRSHRPQRDSDRHDESGRKSPPQDRELPLRGDLRRLDGPFFIGVREGISDLEPGVTEIGKPIAPILSADNDEGVAVSISARRLVTRSTSGSLLKYAAERVS